MDLYQQNILEHYKKPSRKGEVKGGLKGEAANPLCGDRLEVSLKLEAGKVSEFRWQGEGCVLSLAAADMLVEEFEGKKLEELKKVGKETVLALIHTAPSPSRLKCALLVLAALDKALFND